MNLKFAMFWEPKSKLRSVAQKKSNLINSNNTAASNGLANSAKPRKKKSNETTSACEGESNAVTITESKNRRSECKCKHFSTEGCKESFNELEERVIRQRNCVGNEVM